MLQNLLVNDGQAQRSCIFGLQGSGKSVFGWNLTSIANKAFVYDPLDQYSDLPNADTYVPTYRQYSKPAMMEVNEVISRFLLTPEVKRREVPCKYDLFIMDEASRFCPNKRPMPEGIGELNDFHRHYGLALCFIARRPAQLNTNLVELAHWYVIYRLRGRNDHLYLRQISTDVASASYRLQKYHYMLVDENAEFQVCPPLVKMGQSFTKVRS